MKKGNLITWVIILAIIIFGVWTLNKSEPSPEQELVKCIGENSVLYVQTGCFACKKQEDLFGENYEFIQTVNCATDIDECILKGVGSTPTWIINGEKIVGVQTIEELKTLTGCE